MAGEGSIYWSTNRRWIMDIFHQLAKQYRLQNDALDIHQKEELRFHPT